MVDVINEIISVAIGRSHQHLVTDWKSRDIRYKLIDVNFLL